MMQPHERLAGARADKYPSASAAAAALGIPTGTYVQYENGTRGFAKHAERFARFYRVNLEWLVSGRGDKRSKASARAIPVNGLVGAGANIELIDHAVAGEPPLEITLPDIDEVAALVVKGESQWPRFVDGEIILYDPRPAPPDTLLGKYAVVQDLNGRVMIKIVRKGGRPDTYRLESHNAPPEDNVTLMAAWKYLGTITA